MSVEVPCTQCGNAAVELTPPTLTAAVRLIASKMAKMLGAGGELDPDAPIIGMSVAQFAQAFGIRCIACVDAAAPPASEVIDAVYDAPTH